MKKLVLLLLFVLSTTFFVVQHSINVSWDFSVFYLNSRYFLFNTGYFEIRRPPLPAFLMIPGEYFYIIFVSLIGLFSCVKFAKTYNIKAEVFYALILTPFVVFTGFAVGTEFLTLSLTLLLFAFIKNELCGFFFGLSFLAHYTNATTGFFLFLSDDKKKILGSLLLAFLVIAPWLLFNYSVFGDPLYSWFDSYAQNVFFRDYMQMPPNIMDFVIIASFMIPLFFVGLVRSRMREPIDWYMLLFLLVRTVSYLFVPLKIPRYLFTIIIPIAYFSARAFDGVNYKVVYFIGGLTLVSCLFYLHYLYLEPPSLYLDSLPYINASCMVESNAWPFLNYYGVNAGPLPRAENVSDHLNAGYQLVIYKHITDPEYALNESFISSFPKVYESDTVLILSKDSACFEPFSYNISYMQELGIRIGFLDILKLS